MISEEVLKTTREILAESLGVSEEEIKLESYLIEDLGAESIDFLDIFQLAEMRLGIRISEADIAPDLRPSEDESDEASEQDINRLLTDEELEELKGHLPPSTHDRIKPGLHV